MHWISSFDLVLLARSAFLHRRIRLDFNKDTDKYTTNLPDDAVPIEVKETPHTWIRPSQITLQDMILPGTEDVTTIPNLVDTMDPWEHQLLLEITFLKSEVVVWDHLCKGQCFVASDGSAPKR